jgi:hypothetical protein
MQLILVLIIKTQIDIFGDLKTTSRTNSVVFGGVNNHKKIWYNGFWGTKNHHKDWFNISYDSFGCF